MNPFQAYPARWPATPQNVALAQAFVLARWQERHDERFGSDEGSLRFRPTDLSSSCKFSSIFALAVFGGKLEGNPDHQFVRLSDGQVLDLNHGAQDVLELGERAHRHNPAWWGCRDHKASLKSCLPRALAWVAQFEQDIGRGLLEVPSPSIKRRAPRP